jgi:hypothetical protein
MTRAGPVPARRFPGVTCRWWRHAEMDGGPLIRQRITESEQKSFDATHRKVYRFRNQPQDS